MTVAQTHRALFATFALTILFALHYGIPLYATSSYLRSSGISNMGVSFLYGFSALLTLLFSNHIAKYVKRYHTYPFTFFVVISEIVITLLFAVTKSPPLIALFFVLHFILTAILLVLLNIFVESFTIKKETGLVRGAFLTLLNTGILIAPLIGGIILVRTHSNYSALYIAASIALVPFLYFLHRYLKEIKDPHYESHSLLQALKKIMHSRDLRAATAAQFALHSFYTVMIIYAPIYVTNMLHIPLSLYLTTIAPIALIPLVVLPYELGYLADEKYGEKEFMVVGLSLVALMSFVLGYIHTSSILLITIILFFSRVGAALVETMAFTYYYKKINREDPAMTNFFTNINAFASFVVPASLFLLAPFVTKYPQSIFICLGIGVLSTLYFVAFMKDTK